MNFVLQNHKNTDWICLVRCYADESHGKKAEKGIIFLSLTLLYDIVNWIRLFSAKTKHRLMEFFLDRWIFLLNDPIVIK